MVSKSGTLGTRAITGDGLHVVVKRRVEFTGIPGPVGFHSLRAGFVTQARRAGADTRAVRRQTRHSSDAMVELYDRDHAPLLGNAVTTLGL
jgi:integrase